MSVGKVVRFVVSFGLLCVAILAQETSIDKRALKARTQAFEEQLAREILKVLPSVSVIAEFNFDETSETSQRLKVAIELRLRTNGIPVPEEPGFPSLVFQMHYIEFDGHFFYDLRVQLFEAVVLKRNGLEMITNTWKCKDSGMVLRTPDHERLRVWALDRVDHFCNDYLAANPKQP